MSVPWNLLRIAPRVEQCPAPSLLQCGMQVVVVDEDDVDGDDGDEDEDQSYVLW